MNTLARIRLHPRRRLALMRAAGPTPEHSGYTYDHPRHPTDAEIRHYRDVRTEHLVWTAAELRPSEHALLRDRLRAIAILVHARDRGEHPPHMTTSPPQQFVLSLRPKSRDTASGSQEEKDGPR